MDNRPETDNSLDWLGSWNLTTLQVEEEAKAWGMQPMTPSTPFNPNTTTSSLPATPVSFGRYLDSSSNPHQTLREKTVEYVWTPHVQIPHSSNGRRSPTMVANYVAIEPSNFGNDSDSSSYASDLSPPMVEVAPKRKTAYSSAREESSNAPKRRASGDRETPQMEPVARSPRPMKAFSAAQVSDWKHVLYNLLVESHNNENNSGCLVSPVEVLHAGQKRQGFSFNPNLQPRKKIAELYAHHVRKETLEQQDPKSNFTEDLYKYYLRCAYQLMCKYFMKVGPFTYVYEEVPLFIAGETLADAEDRLRNIDTKHRRKKKKALLQG